MTKILLALAATATLAPAANAACTKSSLNGSWALQFPPPISYKSTMSGGVFVYNVDANNSYGFKINTLSSSKCRGSGVFTIKSGGTLHNYQMNVAMEHIDSGSSLKPNVLQLTVAIAPPANYALSLVRQ
mgnify:CR=1 FL=1